MSSKWRGSTLEDPAWTISFVGYDPDDEGRREATLALGNGVFVTRAASLDARADDYHYPGTYRAACYERLISEVAGEREDIESLANLPNWASLNFRMDNGRWFHLDEVELLDYCHALDLKRGLASRGFMFSDDQGRRTQVRELRLVSMADPHSAALKVEITAKNWSGDLEFSSGINGDIVNSNVARYAAYESRHIEILDCGTISASELQLSTRTRRSDIRITQAIRTELDGGASDFHVLKKKTSIANQFRRSVATGEKVVIEKLAAIYTSDDSADPNESARAELAKAQSFAALRDAHERAWEELWRQTDISAENEVASLALRFHAFHILQTVSPHSAKLDTGVPARGWHGEAYRGHIFWDDLFVFPFLNFRFPELAKSLLLYRYRRLDTAREAASAAGYRGAMFPWRSARTGREVTPRHQYNLLSGRWMSDPTRLQHHINSAIVYNLWHYYLVTNDIEFLSDFGAEIILEAARFWASIAEYSPKHDRYEIKGVIGPDEYHNSYPDRPGPGLDNNAYTNVMAVWTLCRGLEVLDRLGSERRNELVRQLALSDEEFELWDAISRKMRVVFHGDGIISQFEGFEKLREFSPDLLPAEFANKRVDWALEAIGESADNYQVAKQADALTLFYLLTSDEIISLLARLGYEFDREQLLRTAEYYLARTTHRSSLSRIVYAGALATVDLRRSWNIYRQALDTDLHALKGESVAEGIHLGAMGGSLDILQRRYLGVDVDVSGALRLEPAVPPELGRVQLGLHYCGSDLVVAASSVGLFIRSEAGNEHSVELVHGKGQRKTLKPGEEFFLDTSPQD